MTIQTSNGQPPQDDKTGLGLSDHDKAMIAKAEGTAGAESSQPVKPDHIPDKFWDAEKGVVKVDEMAKSYAELERGKGQQPAAQQGTNEAAKSAEEAAKAAGADTSKVDFNALSAEFATNGELSDASYQALRDAGLDRGLVDQFIAGQQAMVVQMENEAFGLAGGEQQYYTMLDWAAKNLPQAERDAFDAAVVGTSASRKQAITALQAQFERAVGRNPQLVQGNGSGSNQGGYQSRAEMVRDMSNPKYQKDPAFRAMVSQKLANSDIF